MSAARSSPALQAPALPCGQNKQKIETFKFREGKSLQAIWLSIALTLILLFTWLLLRSGPSRLPSHAETRVPLEVPVHLLLGESELEVMSADISKAGMRLRLDRPASVGQPLEMEFALP